VSGIPFLKERGLSLGGGVAWAAGFAKTLAAVHLVQPLRRRPFRPFVLTLYVTYRCNSRCRICGIWKRRPSASRDTELSLSEIERITSDPLFSRLRILNINGGEPNLRTDLADIAGSFLRRFPRLEAISINSNGIPPESTERNARAIALACRAAGVRLSVSLSLHGTGPLFDRISGIPGAYVGIMESFARLKAVRKEVPFHLSANCVVNRLNVDHLGDLLDWSRREKIPVAFALGEVRDRFHNRDMDADILLDEAGRRTLAAFLRMLASRRKTVGHHALRYSRLADMVESGSPRSLSCHFYMGGAVLDSNGLLYYCKNSPPLGDCRERSAEKIYFDPASLAYWRDGLKNGRCRSCPPYTMNQLEVAKDLFSLLAFRLHPPPGKGRKR
jgi:MoaA/NifB/PqqE/SkfB family radical SAM enzyme